jgi:hypothetical protein
MENELLKQLTKEDLIKVIANIYNSSLVKELGLPNNDSILIDKIGSACLTYCTENNNWKITN